jgi:uncharacterized protein
MFQANREFTMTRIDFNRYRVSEAYLRAKPVSKFAFALYSDTPLQRKRTSLRRISSLVVGLLALLPVGSHAQSQRWESMYVFGDSYSDTGAGYVDGNGPTAVAYLAASLGIPFTYSGDPDAKDKSLNFAVSAGQTGSGEGSRIESKPTGPQFKEVLLGRGMRNQVLDFTRRVKLESIAFDPDKTLFFIAGGLNDGALPTTTTISNLEDEIRQLYSAGGRYFLVAVLPTKIPAFSAVGIRLNPALARIPQDMRSTLPDAHIEMSNWGRYFDEVMENPARYGIVNTKDPCTGRAISGEDATPCASPDAYFYFHAGHPSTAVHKVVARKMEPDVRNAFSPQHASAAAAPVLEIIEEHGVTMKTRDNVTLRADIYRPASEEKYPTLLQRTPYDKDVMEQFARKAAGRGYLVVIQDVRGRYSSGGEWYPFKHESDDGYDTVEWAAALPNSDGRVDMFGGSYVGATQMLAAIAHPPHLAGICPYVTASNYHENWTYQGGAFEQWFNESWTSGLAQDTLARVIRQTTNAQVGAKVLPLDRYPVFDVPPLQNAAALTGEIAPYFLDWLAHPTYDDYWKRWSIEENFQNIQVPALTIAAWYDIFLGGSLRNYLGMKEHAGSETARKGQRLLIVIGGHSGAGRKIGAIDFGPAASEFDENSVTLEWYEYLFKGKQNEFATGKPVRVFVMGKNEWRDEESWPLERAKPTRYLLQSGDGKANSTSGTGTLSTTAAQGASMDSYVYDPADPVPTVGGPLCCDGEHLASGPRDQKDLEKRQDVLVYSTPPLDAELEVTGPVTVDLFAKSSAVDTDFTAKLVDVGPDGFAQNITEGILRARFRESTIGAPQLITPGQVYEYKIDLWSTSNVFLKGHRIRLEVSSSNFPRFDRNLNTGKDSSSDSMIVKATNELLHDAAHPSTLILPVVAK